MTMTTRQRLIINMLPKGDKNPITTKHLASMLGVNTRAVRKDVEILITQHGIPVGSKREGGAGYYLIENSEQRDNALMPIYSQIRAENIRIHALETVDIADFWTKKKAGAFTD